MLCTDMSSRCHEYTCCTMMQEMVTLSFKQFTIFAVYLTTLSVAPSIYVYIA